MCVYNVMYLKCSCICIVAPILIGSCWPVIGRSPLPWLLCGNCVLPSVGLLMAPLPQRWAFVSLPPPKVKSTQPPPHIHTHPHTLSPPSTSSPLPSAADSSLVQEGCNCFCSPVAERRWDCYIHSVKPNSEAEGVCVL